MVAPSNALRSNGVSEEKTARKTKRSKGVAAFQGASTNQVASEREYPAAEPRDDTARKRQCKVPTNAALKRSEGTVLPRSPANKCIGAPHQRKLLCCNDFLA